MAQKHIDGLTGQEFASEQEYLDHVSPVTGYTPKDLEHHGSRGILVAKAAMYRGGKKLTKAEQVEFDKRIESVEAENIDHKLSENRKEVAERAKVESVTK